MNTPYPYRLNAILFMVPLGILGILFFVLPKQQVSEIEKRELASMPSFSAKNFFKGEYTKGLDLYFSDNFPFREGWVTVAQFIENHRGIANEEVKFYAEGIDMDAGIDAIAAANDSLQGDSLQTVGADSLAQDSSANNLFENEGFASDVQRLSRGLLIYEGMAIQMFGGSRNTAKFWARVVNEYQKKLAPKGIQLHCGVTPTHGEFYLPSEYIAEAVSERKNIDTIYHYLDSSVHAFDVTTELFKHKDEYLFFNTDHHWTGRGAYYAYKAFCDEAGLKAIPIEEMEQGTIPNFLGSLYLKTRDKRLKEKGDSVEYFKIPYRHKTYRLVGADYSRLAGSRLYIENAKGGAAYGVFLGGDYPAICVFSEQDTANHRRAVVIKNSYGNPFATYIPSHFERTYVIDYRYFKGNLMDFMEKNKVTDLIFFHNSFSANTPSHVKMIKRLLTEGGVCAPHAVPARKKMFPMGDFLVRHFSKAEKYNTLYREKQEELAKQAAKAAKEEWDSLPEN